MLKTGIILFYVALLCHNGLYACSRHHDEDSATVIITLNNHCNHDKEIDSVYLIFDRCDGSGAGVIRQIFHPAFNEIAVQVPKGKYFVDVYCLGTYCERLRDCVVRVKSRKTNKLLINLKETSFFTPGKVNIPQEQVDFSNLSITRYSAFR